MAEWSPFRALAPAAFAFLALALPPERAEAQEDCEWLPPSGEFSSQTLGSTTIVRVTTPHLRCQDGIRLRADSARHFENSDFFQLFGDALFEQPDQRLEGDRILYWRNDGRVQAEGNVRLTRAADGSVITGESLSLLQAGEQREQDQLTVTGARPRVVFHPGAGGAGTPDTTTTPWDIVADRLFFQGQTFLVASGDVEVQRDSVRAYAEVLEFEELEDRLLLRRDARMVTPGYELTGDSILGLVVDDEIRRLTSFDDAVLVGEDVRIAAPRIVVETPRGAMERLIASRAPARPPPPGAGDPAEEPPARTPGARPETPDTLSVFEMDHPPRPVARAEDFLMVADSIDVQAPDEVLQRIIAVGTARGESTGRDSLNTAETPEIARRDWIHGDTIIASFARAEPAVGAVEDARGVEAQAAPPGAPSDDGREYRLEELVARVNARSLYRMAPADSAEAASPEGGSLRLAVHYVTGKEITISLEEGEVREMRVVGPTDGVHLEPIGGRMARPDTAAADTAGVDTVGAAADTTATATGKSSPGTPLAGAAAPAGGEVDPSPRRRASGPALRGPGGTRSIPRPEAGGWR